MSQGRNTNVVGDKEGNSVFENTSENEVVFEENIERKKDSDPRGSVGIY
jgi:hypothetical protein